ncbi:MAG: DUF58 domain-containing protein [Pseudomonadota bacterium]
MAVLSSAQLGWLPDAELRHQLIKYSLAPALQVDNAIHASHRSVRRDEGIEFSRFRPFQPGDDLRRVDWRVFGRTDRLLVRESESEGRLTVVLVVDLSASMGMADSRDVTRYDYVARLVGALAWLAAEHHHDVMLIGLQTPTPIVLPTGAGRAQLERVIRRLDEWRPSGGGVRIEAISEALSHAPARSAVFAFSDYLGDDCGLQVAVARTAARGMSLTSTQVLLPQELSPPPRGQFRVVDCESGSTRWFDAGLEGREYRKRLNRLLREIREDQVRSGARFVSIATDIGLAESCHAMLAQSITGRQRVLATCELS